MTDPIELAAMSAVAASGAMYLTMITWTELA